MPESGSGSQAQQRLPMPLGWVAAVSGSAVISPSWEHTPRPERLSASEQRIRDIIDKDPGLHAAFDAHADELRAIVWDLPGKLDRIIAIATELAEQHCPPGANQRAVLQFLLVEWLSPFFEIESVLEAIEPVYLVANTGSEPYNLEIGRGEFGMRFSGAKSEDRAAFNGVIKQAQIAFGHASDEGGRRRRTRSPETGEQARIAAKLHHWQGWTYTEIAALFGWNGALDSVRERVRLYVRDGEAVLEEEIGSTWKTTPPPALVNPAGDRG